MEYTGLASSFDAVTARRTRARPARVLAAFALGVAGALTAGRLLRARASDAEPERRDGLLDEVDEASDESFPSSDPPAYTPTHAGSPDHHQDRRGAQGEGEPEA